MVKSELIEKLAEKGNIILLAPACSSFDEFANYKERGEEFKRLVTQYIRTQQGELS